MPRRTLRILLLAAIVGAVLLLLGRRAAALLPEFAARVEDAGALGPLLFALGYIVATVAFVPGSLLTLAGGALFGIARGTALVFAAATIGATIAFLVARHLARSAVERRVAHDPRFRALDEAIRRDGLRMVLLLRLSPAFPFNLLNYALGLTSVRLRDYMAASVGMLPGTLLYVYYGRVIGDVAGVVAGTPVEHGTGYWIVLGIGLLATLAATLVVARMAKRALRPALEKET